MANNVYNNAVKITKAALAVIEADATVLKHVRRDDKEFAQDGTAKGGDTRNIRIPGYGVWREGRVAQPSAVSDTYIPVTLTQGGADFMVSSAELTLNIDELSQILRPRISRVINKLDEELWALYKKIPIVYGSASGARPTALLPYSDARASIHIQSGAPKDGTDVMVLHELSQSSLVGNLGSIFNPQADIAKQYREGNLGRVNGMACSTDRNATTHTAGVQAGSPTMNGTTAEGATSFVTQSWSSGASTLNAGDVYTVDNVYAVDPISGLSTGILKQWCVLTTVSDSGGAMTIVNTESCRATAGSTSGLPANVNALPLTTARVRPFFSTGAVAAQSLVFHPDGLIFASAPLADMGENCHRLKAPDLNLSIRCYEYTDGPNDQKLWRLDVLRGVALGRPGFAARVAG